MSDKGDRLMNVIYEAIHVCTKPLKDRIIELEIKIQKLEEEKKA